MPFSAIVVDQAPDPIAIAARLEGRPGLSLLHSAGAAGSAGTSFIACDPIESSSSLLPEASALELTGEGDTRGRAPRWIGAIPYECARSLERPGWTRRPEERPRPHVALPIWHRYQAVVEVDSAAGIVRVVGDNAGRVEALARDIGGAGPRRPEARPVRFVALPDDDPPRAHIERIRRAKELIRAGDLYQVNLARRLRFEVEGSSLDLYLAMAKQAPARFGAYLDLGGTVVCACSPELFLRLDRSGIVRTVPIKGTRPRGGDAALDRQLARELDESPKEQAELTMILDVERNDLGRVAIPGSVRLVSGPTVDSHRSVHHRAAVVGAELRSDKSALDLVTAMFPSGSVTGAPKVRAMEVIAVLEPVRRGLYTGAFGAVAFDGSLTLAMAIRVLTIQNREGHYFAGGGIVADSDPEAELLETRWKGAQLGALLEPRVPEKASGNLA
jgi:anthranilate/para-aminobenzoate synthase component I